MSPNEFAGLLHQILSGGVLVASLILKTVCLADHLSTEMPVTMINKPVALLDNIDRTYAFYFFFWRGTPFPVFRQCY